MIITAKIVVDRESKEVLITGWQHIPDDTDIFAAIELINEFFKLVGYPRVEMLKFQHCFFETYGIRFKYKIAL